MTTELRTIQIEAYLDTEGRPVCANVNGGCPMFFPSSDGSVPDICMYSQTVIPYRRGQYSRPVEGCPVWGDK